MLLCCAFYACSEEHRPPPLPQGRPSLEDFVGAEPTLEAAQPLLRLISPEESGVTFANNIQETIENNLITNVNIYNGGGIATADFNNDGLTDIFLVASNGPNALYLNEGGLHFRDVTETAGLAAPEGFKTAAVAVDVNADGWMDIYLCRAGTNIRPEDRRNLLFVNNRDGSFTDRAAAYGLDNVSLSVGANFFDYDLDGDLDLYLLNTPTTQSYISQLNITRDSVTGKASPFIKPVDELDTDRLFRNNGNGTFSDVSRQAGIWNLGYSQSVAVSDINRDGYPDVYVANDYVQPDLFYINNGDGTFTDRLSDYFQHTAQHTMGTDIADFDNDGLLDLVTLDMAPVHHYRRKTTTNTNSQSRYNTIIQYGYFEPVVRNTLQRNNGNGTFSDIACLAGIDRTDWSWGCLLFDVDNDGFKDLTISNGFRREVTDADFINFVYPQLSAKSKVRPFRTLDDIVRHIPVYKVRNFIFRNTGAWAFEDKSGEWCTVPPSWSNGSAYADLDGDGDLEWIVNNLEEPPFLYENLSAGRPDAHFIQLRLTGRGANPSAIGAAVTLTAGSSVQFQELHTTRGIFSTVEPLLHFGLGAYGGPVRIEVRWPDGTRTLQEGVQADQRLEIRQPVDAGPAILPPTTAAVFAPDIHSGLSFRHQENIYDDLDHHFLLPWRLSELGPGMAAADVNADGRQDLYIGNAYNSPGSLFLQSEAGRFEPALSPDLQADAIYEDNDALFFDADGDQDQDLFIVSGGVEGDTSLAWQSRLYLNDGTGRFSKAPAGTLPDIRTPGKAALAADIDADGDLDLLLGGRVSAGQYPLPPVSMVLRNDNGRFSDVTNTAGGDFTACGMVTDLQWSDLDGNGRPELVVVGEWMPVSVFEWTGSRFQDRTSAFGLVGSNGLWGALGVADLDGDGDTDLITGNFGRNSPLRASDEAPLRCFSADFDDNGSIEPIMAYYEDGFLFPYRHRDILIKQLPPLKKKFLFYKDYGAAVLQDVFPGEVLSAAHQSLAYTLASCWWENRNGRFVRHELPIQAQSAPVQDILVHDVDRDGHADLFLLGNKYAVEVETGRCDAGTGCLLKSDGEGGLSWVPNPVSGLWAQGNVRSALVIRRADGRESVVVAENNGPVTVFTRSD
ncbi:MAG: hypothetical protein RLY31_1967 [Bacteroidota bacterium]